MKTLAIACLALTLAACASTTASNAGSAQAPAEEKVYRTGSNIPVRDPVSSSPTTVADPAALKQGMPPRVN